MSQNGVNVVDQAPDVHTLKGDQLLLLHVLLLKPALVISAAVVDLLPQALLF